MLKFKKYSQRSQTNQICFQQLASIAHHSSFHALHKAATQAKENLHLQKEDSIMFLADKGYHTGAELQQCQQDNMITHVAYKEQSPVKHIDEEFLAWSFDYNQTNDTYTCLAGALLTSRGI